MFPDRGMQLVVYHGVLLIGAGREGEGRTDLDLGGDVAGNIEQHRVPPGAGPHEDGHLVTRGLAGGGRLGACGLLKKRVIVRTFQIKVSNVFYTCWLFPVLV